MNPTLTVPLFSLLFLAIVLLFTLALSNLAIPRYKRTISPLPDDTQKGDGKARPAQPGGGTTEELLVPRDEANAETNIGRIFRDHLSGSLSARLMEDRPKESEPEEIAAQYLVSYAQRVYLNQLFRLRVEIGMKGTPLSADPGRREAARGSLRFTHRWFQMADEARHPRPDIRVELKYDEEEFRVMNPVQVKPLPAVGKVAYDFAVKSLKSEDSALSVEIAYVGSKWQPQKVTMIELTDDNGRATTTTKAIPAGIIEEVDVLASEELTIETKSLLNMNAASLNIFNKAAAIFLTVIYIGAVVGFGLTENTTATVIVGLTSVVSALGIPVAGDLWKNAQVNQEKAVVG